MEKVKNKNINRISRWSGDINYTQKEKECEFASLKFSVSNVSNSDLYCAIFLKKVPIACLKSSLVR
jgi:hypothetical protein